MRACPATAIEVTLYTMPRASGVTSPPPPPVLGKTIPDKKQIINLLIAKKMDIENFTNELEEASRHFASLYGKNENDRIYQLVFTAGAVWYNDFLNKQNKQ